VGRAAGLAVDFVKDLVAEGIIRPRLFFAIGKGLADLVAELIVGEMGDLARGAGLGDLIAGGIVGI
jgi:hypothetical protein